MSVLEWLSEAKLGQYEEALVQGGGLMLSASRSVLYASDEEDFGQAARDAALELREAINTARREPASGGAH